MNIAYHIVALINLVFMNPAHKKFAKQVMDKLKRNEINEGFFRHPVDPKLDGLIDYSDYVSEPMCFDEIMKNLQGDKYRNIYEWYDHVSLVFDNAIKYHSQSQYGKPEFVFLAEYCKKQFQQEAGGYNYMIKEWVQAVQERTEKLNNILRNPPSNPKFIDSEEFRSIVRIAEHSEPPTRQEMTKFVEKLNPMLEKDDSFRKEMIIILRYYQCMTEKEATTVPVDFDNLSPLVQNILIQFTKHKEEKPNPPPVPAPQEPQVRASRVNRIQY